MKIYQKYDTMHCPFSKRLLTSISNKSFVCLGAQNAARTKNIAFLSLDRMTVENAEVLVANIEEWIKEADYATNFCDKNFKFISFVVTFSEEKFTDENSAEKALWKFLSQVHTADAKRNRWDEDFSQNVYSQSFAFSVGGYGHFIPLLHPQASSLVRRTEVCTLVFNPHGMFTKMKSLGFFNAMRDVIRDREYEAQSWVNPKLSNAGENLEAPQYALTRNSVFNIGACPFTGYVPREFPTYSL